MSKLISLLGWAVKIKWEKDSSPVDSVELPIVWIDHFFQAQFGDTSMHISFP